MMLRIKNFAQRCPDLVYLFFLFLLWILSILIVNPTGEFPLNDDWSYAIPVKSFIEQGKFKFIEWPAMTLIGHTLAGSLFCFGKFSFLSLRLYVLLSGFIGIVAVYKIMRELQLQAFAAFLIALVLAFNPLYFSLAFTYMTDVHFFCMAALSSLFFLRILNKGSKVNYIYAIIFSLLSVSIRQPGIVFPAAFAVVNILRQPRNLKTILLSLFPVFLCSLFLFLYTSMIRYKIGYPEGGRNSNMELLNMVLADPMEIVKEQFKYFYKIYILLGFFLLPVLLLIIETMFYRKIAKPSTGLIFRIVILLFIILSAILVLYYQGKILFIVGNIFNNLGLGPITLYDFYYLGLSPVQLPKWFWLICTFVGSSFGLLMILSTYNSIKKLQGLNNKEPFLYAFLSFGLYFPLVTVISFYDRYILIPMLMTLIMLVSSDFVIIKNKILRGIALPMLIVATCYSVFATKDYLSWNRKRWEALNFLTHQKKVSPQNIDGGFEFNGWYNYDANYKRQPGKSLWWVIDNEYMITLHPVPGYKVFRKIPYERYIPYRTDYVYILKRESIL
jgi:hypothetical protein